MIEIKPPETDDAYLEKHRDVLDELANIIERQQQTMFEG